MKFDRNIISNARKLKIVKMSEAETLLNLMERKDNKSASIKVYSAIGLMINEHQKRGFKND
jgi:hypothetical protein